MRKTLILLIILSGCNSNKIPKASPEFITLLNKEKSFINAKLKLNGYYSLDPIPTGNPKISGPSSPVIFYGNGIIYHENSLFQGEKSLSNFLEKRGAENTVWNQQGTFEVKNDTIYAIMFCKYNRNNASLYARELTYFRGVTKGDSIVDWKMVQPYPKAPYKYPVFNEKVIESQATPKILHYHHFPLKSLLDSNKLYVNDYRTKPEAK